MTLATGFAAAVQPIQAQTAIGTSAPDLFARQGDVSRAQIEEIRKIVATVPDAQVMADLDATAGWAAANGGDPARLGVTGFCWGGRITWLYAAHNPNVKAAVAWYGPVAKPPTPLTPRQPVDIAGELKAPVLGLHAGADAGIPNDTVERMRAAIKAAGKPSEIVLYPDMPHAFHADYRPTFRKEGGRWLAAHAAMVRALPGRVIHLAARGSGP